MLPWILSIGCGLVLPFFLASLASTIKYSELIEELCKAFSLIAISFWADKKQMPYLGIVLGFLFGISESFLYLGNYIFAQSINYFFARLMLTVPMHAFSAFIMGWFLSINKKCIVIGFIIAVMVHVAFNLYVPYFIK
jgi:RsiW-degrading membrane proteinase PrsW (M82 family)